jgi:hypothetical protein
MTIKLNFLCALNIRTQVTCKTSASNYMDKLIRKSISGQTHEITSEEEGFFAHPISQS